LSHERGVSCVHCLDYLPYIHRVQQRFLLSKSKRQHAPRCEETMRICLANMGEITTTTEEERKHPVPPGQTTEQRNNSRRGGGRIVYYARQGATQDRRIRTRPMKRMVRGYKCCVSCDQKSAPVRLWDPVCSPRQTRRMLVWRLYHGPCC